MPAETLVVSVMAFLLPYVVKGGEAFAEKVGEETFNLVHGLWQKVKAKLAGDAEAADAVARFEQKPERYKAVLEDLLGEKVNNDPELKALLTQFMQQAGPKLEVVQTMDRGVDVTGLEAERLRSGTATVKQDIKDATRVTGANVKDIG